MTFGDILQNVVTGSAVFLGIVYITGGLIVNLNLTRRGVVEYQILKVKFLAVGVIFLFHSLGVIVFALIPVMVVFPLSRDPVLALQVFGIPSILAALTLLYVASRYPSTTKSFVGKWWFRFVLSVLASLFPLLVLLRLSFFPEKSLVWLFWSVFAVLTGLLAIMAQIYHYSSFYYGRPADIGVLDPIGMGIPTRVDIVCDEKISSDLTELGLPIQKNIIRDIYLIDETSEHYIISQEQVPGDYEKNQTCKIDKGLVKAILHKPDPIRKPENELSKKKRS